VIDPKVRATLTALDHALWAAKTLGLPVFPIVENGRVPAIGGWQQRATTDEAKIRAMWTEKDPVLGVERVKPYNIGVYTGGLLVGDVDVKKGKQGQATFDEMDLMYGFADTFTVKTPSGGLHLYYKPKGPSKSGVNNVGPGFDTRGVGGYVVGPGSTIDGKSYEVIKDVPIAEAPKWFEDHVGRPEPKSERRQVIELLDTQPAIDRAVAYLAGAEPAVENSGGNDHTYRVALRVKDFGVSELTALELMDEHWNDRCAPRWDWEELAGVVSNAYRYGKRPVGEAAPEADFKAESSDDFPIEKAPEKQRAAPIFWDDEDDAPEPDPLIENVVDKGACVLIYGKPNVGKTFVAYTMSRCVAAGKPFGDKEVEQGAVLYIQCEGHAGVRRRRRALRVHFKDKNIPLVFLKASVNLVKNAADRQWLADQIIAVEARLSMSVALVVIDTLSAAAPGMDENAAGEVSAALAAMKGFTCDRGITLAIVHHEGKNSSGGPRGSSAFSGNVDTVIHVTDGSIVSDKARESAKLEPLPFTLEVLTVGQTLKGRDVTSCVAVIHGSATKEFGRLPMSGLERVAYETLEQMDAEAELDGEDAEFTSAAWQTRLKTFPTGFPTEKGFKQRFFDVRNGLVGKGYVSKSLKDTYKLARSERSERSVGT
jgi:hypothetical protein